MWYNIRIILKISHQNLPANNNVFESYYQKRKELREISNSVVGRKGVTFLFIQSPVSLRMRKMTDRKQPLWKD